jgi:hypothetical protein
VGCLGTSAIARATGGSSPANELEAEAAENAGERFRVIVPCHDSAGWDIPRIEAGEEKELSVP